MIWNKNLKNTGIKSFRKSWYNPPKGYGIVAKGNRNRKRKEIDIFMVSIILKI